MMCPIFYLVNPYGRFSEFTFEMLHALDIFEDHCPVVETCKYIIYASLKERLKSFIIAVAPL